MRRRVKIQKLSGRAVRRAQSPKENNLSIIQIVDTFTFYGIDVLLLATLTCLTVQLLKATILKKLNRKLVTFLPFILGTIFYAAYSAIKNLSLEFLLTDYVFVLEHGVSVGAAATLIYVLYEQFVREKKSGLSTAESVIKTLIEGYVPKASVEDAAKQIAEAVKKDATAGGAKRAEEILAQFVEENITSSDVQLIAKLIIETLAHVTTA